MINRNNGSILRFFLIFSMNFAWIANVFGFIGSKKESFSFKRVTKSLNKADSVKKNDITQVFELKKINSVDFVNAIVYSLHKNAVMPARRVNARFISVNDPSEQIKQQILFPHHGFW